MRKILVIGSGGSGKSTVATRLSALLNLEVEIVWLRSQGEVEKFLGRFANTRRAYVHSWTLKFNHLRKHSGTIT
jgi:adenylate kinase family enzyme